LHLDNGAEACGGHAGRRAYDEGLLNGCVEYPLVAKFLSKRRCFAEDSAQASSDVLTVQQSFGMVGQDFLHGVQCAVHH